MEISEGDVFVNPDGQVGTVEYVNHNKNTITPVNCPSWYKIKHLIKAADPLRVRVDHEADAKALIERSGEAGFNHGSPEQVTPITFILDPRTMGMRIVVSSSGDPDHDLTYPSNSDQIIGWLDFHASEDDDQRWESPDPSDPAWRDLLGGAVLNYREGDVDLTVERLERFGLEPTVDPLRILCEATYKCIETIDDLEAERDELKNKLQAIEDLSIDWTGQQAIIRSLKRERDELAEKVIQMKLYQGVEPEYHLIKKERDELRERIRRLEQHIEYMADDVRDTVEAYEKDEILDGEGESQ